MSSDITCIGFQQIPSLLNVQALTVPAAAVFCTVQAAGQAVRFRMDGTDPTFNTGQRLTVGPDMVRIDGPLDMRAARFIQEAASATLEVHYWGATIT